MPTSDLIQHKFEVGDIVNIPCKVLTIAGTTAKPTVTLQTKYPNFAGSLISLADTLDVIQVVKDL